MTTVTPTAIDAYVFIESIRVVDRHRKDLGDLESLAMSIEDIGLLNPVTITPDSRLVAGQRRLEACRRLGWDSVPVRIAQNLGEAARLLRAERDENVERKAMLPSEKAALGEALHAIHAGEAKQRQGTRTELGHELRDAEGTKSAGAPGSTENKTRAIVGEALGMSGTTYADLSFVHRTANDPDVPDDLREVARDGLAEMDRTGHIRPVADRVRARVRARRDADEAKAAALAVPTDPAVRAEEDALDPAWIPGGRDSSPNAVKQRRKLIAYHAGRGLSSRQIAEIVGVEDTRVRKLARDGGIEIPADKVMARTRHIDSNRVVRETVAALDGSAMGVQLVNLNNLDPAEMTGWVSSMNDSLRVLNRFLKQLKEKTRED